MKDRKEPFLDRHPVLNTIIGLLLLLALLTASLFLIRWVFRNILAGLHILRTLASSLDAVVIVALITGGLSVLGVVISSIIAKIIDYNKARQDYLAKKRESSYESFIGMVYKIKDANESEDILASMIDDINDFSKELTLWGSKRVVRKWLKFRDNSKFKTDPKQTLEELEDIMNEMRRDMRVGRVKV